MLARWLVPGSYLLTTEQLEFLFLLWILWTFGAVMDTGPIQDCGGSA